MKKYKAGQKIWVLNYNGTPWDEIVWFVERKVIESIVSTKDGWYYSSSLYKCDSFEEEDMFKYKRDAVKECKRRNRKWAPVKIVNL